MGSCRDVQLSAVHLYPARDAASRTGAVAVSARSTPGFHNGRYVKVGLQQPPATETASGDASFDRLTKAELLDEAKRRNVEVSERATKAEIISALEAANG